MVYLFMSNIFLIFVLKVMITYSGWGRNTSWSVDSNLPLYIIKDPQLFVKDIVVHIKSYSYIYYYVWYTLLLGAHCSHLSCPPFSWINLFHCYGFQVPHHEGFPMVEKTYCYRWRSRMILLPWSNRLNPSKWMVTY